MNLEAAAQNYETASGLLFTGFNQDGGCFAVGCERGFQIFNSDPMTEKTRKGTLEVSRSTYLLPPSSFGSLRAFLFFSRLNLNFI